MEKHPGRYGISPLEPLLLPGIIRFSNLVTRMLEI